MRILMILAFCCLAAAEPPGVYNPQVTAGTIHSTICKPGWTKTVRPPASYTNKLKAEQMAELGLSGKPHDYEEDHFIPLELGGNPTDPENLWPEPWPEARTKDRIENYLHRQVCRGTVGLDDARGRIREWRKVKRK